MRELHVTAEVLDRFARGDLDDGELSDVLDHLENCESCAHAGQVRAAGDLTALRDDLTESEPATPRPRVFVWTIAAAAAIAILVLSALLLPKERPAVTPTPPRVAKTPRPSTPVVVEPPRSDGGPTYAHPEWRKAVLMAIEKERLPFPRNLDALRAPADVVRGSGGAIERIAPAGVVLDQVRPTFTWPARNGGTYTLFIFADEREVMRSPLLSAPHWVPDRNLPRGQTLTWQVEVTGSAPFETIPSPPSPPAMFRIVTDADHRDLVEARERHPGDDLLMAVLHARSGMRDEALAALRRAALDNPAAKRILDHETSAPR